jgi:hypothetical protein
MTTSGQLRTVKRKSHAYADLFPMMTAAELDALTADIAANGLRTPIVCYQGQILDGRNRHLACEKAGREPTFTDYEGDDAGALALVISLNVQRRDLTAGQRAIVAARAMEQMPERRGRPGKNCTDRAELWSREMVAKMFKVGVNAVQQAKALLAEAADLTAQVESCTSSLAAAYEELQSRRQQSAQKARDAARIVEYTEAISNGELTLDQAIQKAIEQEREAYETTAAEADARRHWLKEFAEALTWFETFVAQRTDDHLPWYTLPDSPGLFDHGITAERIDDAIRQLERTKIMTFGGRPGAARRAAGPQDRGRLGPGH